MTISSENSTNRYDGNGSTTVFPYVFKITDTVQLVVKVADADDTATTLVLDTDYTVSGVGAEGGGDVTVGDLTAITGAVKLPTGWTITIRRELALLQPTDLVNQGPFNAETHEDAFDRMVMQLQQQQEQLDRSLKVSDTSGLEGDDLLDEIDNAVAASAASAAASASSASDSADSAVEASGFADNASDSADEAAAAVAQFPTIAGGDAGKMLAVNVGEDGYELQEIPEELPAIQAGDAGKSLKVNATEDGVEYDFASGVGSPDTVHLVRAETSLIGDVDLTGNSADFDGGGTITANSLSISTTAGDLILNTSVFKYVPGADGSGDYFGFTKAIPQGLRGRELGFIVEYRNDATMVDNDFRFAVKIKDGANAGNISYFDLASFASSDGNSKRKSHNAYIPVDCTEVEIGFQNTSTTTTVEFYFDNLSISSNPIVVQNLLETQGYELEQAGNALTDRAAEVEFNLGTATVSNVGANLITPTDDSGNTRTKFIANKDCEVDISVSLKLGTGGRAHIYVNGALKTIGTRVGTDAPASSSAPFILNEGDYFSVGSSTSVISDGEITYLNFTATAETAAVVHAGSGVENNFSARVANSGTATITSQASPDNPAIASVNQTAAGVVDVVFTTDFFSVAPSAIAENNRDAVVDFRVDNITTSGCRVVGTNYSSVGIDADFTIFLQKQGADYILPSANAVTPSTRTAYIKDVKSSGTDGGTPTANTWVQRDLNTLSGDTSFVTLVSNVLTLYPGKYKIKVRAPAFRANGHKIKLVEDPLGTPSDALIGSTAMASSDVTGSQTDSVLEDIIEVLVTTAYDVQHRVQVASGGAEGFGVANTMSVSEHYTEVEIEKLL